MKDLNDGLESPFVIKLSFNKLFNTYETLAQNNRVFSERLKELSKIKEEFPVLSEGFSDVTLLEKYKEQIEVILRDAFNEVLTHNEIKTASVPFLNVIFNSSKRFKKIIEDAGKDFELVIQNVPEDNRYIIGCNIILMHCYGYNINFKRPFFYEIPDAQGVLNYYKVLYNADFLEITPTERAVPIEQKDIDELLDNFENIALWKSKFPPNSYSLKGFVISNIFNTTDDQSISNLKTTLIGKEKNVNDSFIKLGKSIFQSLFRIKDLEVGFTVYNDEDQVFEQVYETRIKSFLLNEDKFKRCEDAFCSESFECILKKIKSHTISDVDKVYNTCKVPPPHVVSLFKQGIKSAIFAPVANQDGLLGVLELVSDKPKVLNSINAHKLDDVMPHIIETIERSKEEQENLIEAIIQKECTSIHKSVHWRFKNEAKHFIKDQLEGKSAVFKKIEFKNIYPLFGQIDIKDSSEARNWATQMDLSLQLKEAKKILEKASHLESLPIYDQYIYQIEMYLIALSTNFQVDSEQKIVAFFKNEINSFFKHIQSFKKLENEIASYFYTIDNTINMLYKHRKKYDDTIAMINKKMATILDEKQLNAQQMYPHFFERYKTDGVEHNMYIGESITKEKNFDLVYLYNLRLWQLQIMCEMENTYYQIRSEFPVSLDVASMILVFSSPLTISFRMDEKKFDVDGTYNARYEIVKKRVDKAFIKGTQERVTQKGKISIIYSQKEDEKEYLQYIKFLQFKQYLDVDVEILDLQDLQAVTGLKAIRVSILYKKAKDTKKYYTYSDLMETIKNE